jgi:NADPH-ferrihemoprotein reductase
MELFSSLSISFDLIISIVVLLITSIIGIYWFWIKPSQSTNNKTNNVQIAIQSLKVKDLGDKPATDTHSTSFVDRMLHSNKTMVIFYGSQTGTAEDFAQRLAKQAKRYGISATVCDPEECEMEELQRLITIEKHLALFCLATYGEGDPTDNAQEFYEWLREDGRELADLHYAVFGLGNKTYEHYNAVGKYVDKRLEELGGVRVCDLGMGDDDGNIEDDFMAWTTVFWQCVCQKYELVIDADGSSMRQYKLVQGPFPSETVFTGEVGRLKSYEKQKPPFDLRNPFLAPVVANRELFQERCLRSCLHLELDISNTRLKYEAGDHVAVFPSNDTALVNRIGELVGTDLDEIISLVNIDEDAQKKNPFPCPCSYRTALTYYLDVTSMPNTQILKDIAQYATDENERALLTLMGSYSEEGKIKYKEWVLDSCRSIVAILEDLPSLKPPLDHLCELLPRLHPRYYSISSSPKVHPTNVHLTAIVVHFRSPTGRVVKGVATNCFRQLHLKHKQTTKDENKENKEQNNENGLTHPDRFPIYIRKSTFRLPFKFQTPIIMIGPGSGLAPFRGFIQERHFYKSQGKPVGETILYYGCRNRAEDFLYQEELKYFESEKSLEMHVAFSRDQEEKIYVTHLLKQQGEKIWKLIKQDNASIYVCGDAKNMARDVHTILTDIAQIYGEMTPERAIAFVKELTQKGRYSQDVWS